MTGLPEIKIGDSVTISVFDDERHENDLWWWDGARCKVTAIHNEVYQVITTEGYQSWFPRRLLVKSMAKDQVQP
jgi:hypothetical protein